MENRILQNARELFFSYGIKSITMDDLARHMGISKKTIYKFYSDKSQLVERLILGLINNHAAQINQLAIQANDAIHEVLLQTQAMINIYLPVKAGVFYEVQKYFPDAWLLFKQYRKEIVSEAIMANLQRGSKEKIYREDLQVELISQYRLAQITDAFTDRYFSSDVFNAAEVIDCGTELYLRSVVMPERVELLENYLERTTNNEYTENEIK